MIIRGRATAKTSKHRGKEVKEGKKFESWIMNRDPCSHLALLENPLLTPFLCVSKIFV
jgi:hypothetical protein